MRRSQHPLAWTALAAMAVLLLVAPGAGGCASGGAAAQTDPPMWPMTTIVAPGVARDAALDVPIPVETDPPDIPDLAALRPVTISADNRLNARPLAELSLEASTFMDGRQPQWGVAVALPGRGAIYEANAEEPFPMASLTKLLIMLTLFDQAETEERELTEDESALLGPMITASDNDSASALWEEIGRGAAVSAFLRSAGVTGIRPAPDTASWGDSTASPAGLAQLLTKLWAGQILHDADRATVFALLTSVSEDQRWGATAAFPGARSSATTAVKNGWYPAITGWRAGSAALGLPEDAEPMVVVVMARNQPSFEYAVATVEGVSAWIGAAVYGMDTPETETPGDPPSPTGLTWFEPADVSALPVLPGNCGAQSAVAIRPGAWRCESGEDAFDPCFSAPGVNGVACGLDPADPAAGIVLEVTGPLPNTRRRVDYAYPWRIELDDGTSCVHVLTAPVDDDQDRISYQCADGRVVIGPLQRGVSWWALAGQADLSEFQDAAVIHAWY